MEENFKTLKLNVKGELITLEPVEKDGVAFYRLNDIWNGTIRGEMMKHPQRWARGKFCDTYKHFGSMVQDERQEWIGIPEVILSYCMWLDFRVSIALTTIATAILNNDEERAKEALRTVAKFA